MMGIFLVLATAASEVHSELAEGGVGLNIDILETNLIILEFIIGVLFYFGRCFLGNILSQRLAAIETAIKEAEKRQKDAAAALSDAQQKLTQAQAEAERIRRSAEERAKVAKEAILAQAAKDVERLKADAARDLNSDLDRVLKELRQRVAALALQQVESQLKSQLNEGTQQQLIDRSITMLGGR